MSRQTDLEHNIRESYRLIRDYEQIIRLSADPKEKARARSAIEEQRLLINQYVFEYQDLTNQPLPAELSQLVTRISIDTATSPLDTDEAEAVRVRYLEALWDRYRNLQTHAFTGLAQDERVGSARQLPLLGKDGVFVPLTFDTSTTRTTTTKISQQITQQKKSLGTTTLDVGRSAESKREDNLTNGSEAELHQRNVSTPTALTLANILTLPGHLAIVGEAGSGKTTLLHVLVTFLAAEDPHALIPEASSTEFSQDLFEALPAPPAIPILLPLRLFEHACRRGQYNRNVADLLRFVDEWFVEWCPDADLPPGFLAAHIRAGYSWLLLDALDEVANPDHRQTIRNIIQELAYSYPKTRMIVTARISGYRKAYLDERFSVVYVRDLDIEQRRRMIHAIYGGLALPNAQTRANDLINRYETSKNLLELGRTPVMVWTAAVIHALRGQLPESRAALYDAYVDILLRHSFKRAQYDTAALEDLTSGGGWPLQDRRHYLTYAAFEAHKLLEEQPERHDQYQLVVGGDELVDTIWAIYFKKNLGLDSNQARTMARQFLTLMVTHSGLIHETSQGYSVGGHLTMQEFLAGCYLGDHLPQEDSSEYTTFLREKVGKSWWHEVFILATGYLAEQPGFAARTFINQIAQQGENPTERVSALTLASSALLQLRHRNKRPTWYNSLARELSDSLYQYLYTGPTDVPVSIRQEAGLILGRLYGFPREDDLHDPRFFHDSCGSPKFVPVIASNKTEFWIGNDNSSQTDESPQHSITLDMFELAQYPTTNAMFAYFIDDYGYQDSRWWQMANGRWANGKIRDIFGERSQPAFWDNPRSNNPSQPIVGITWYEAIAYCEWLSEKVDDGHSYRLSTEAEWEAAARGNSQSPTRRISQHFKVFRKPPNYPWGNDWQLDHCNSKESNLGVTSPVGSFPKGITNDNLYDMAGNVWEWCYDWYDEGYYARSWYAHNPEGPLQGSGRVVRGGSWYGEGQEYCRCGYRYRVSPWGRYDNLGFRIARTRK